MESLYHLGEFPFLVSTTVVNLKVVKMAEMAAEDKGGSDGQRNS